MNLKKMTYEERQYNFKIRPIPNWKKVFMRLILKLDNIFVEKKWRTYCNPIVLPNIKSESFDYHLELRNKERCPCCRGLGFREKQSSDNVAQPMDGSVPQ